MPMPESMSQKSRRHKDDQSKNQAWSPTAGAAAESWNAQKNMGPFFSPILRALSPVLGFLINSVR